MATRNRTFLYRKYRDALKSVRVPTGSSPSSSSSGGPVIELATTTLLNQNRSYAPLSTEDPGTSRTQSLHSTRLILHARAFPFVSFGLENINCNSLSQTQPIASDSNLITSVTHFFPTIQQSSPPPPHRSNPHRFNC
ncbi:unnamed protein product [Ilex paraguariensis]|uniref:Uncharacterized protein n=2 Tax=Ilex paraguariensis TaxID=185542 RepID=A0ABC8TLR9_9AQUA